MSNGIITRILQVLYGNGVSCNNNSYTSVSRVLHWDIIKIYIFIGICVVWLTGCGLIQYKTTYIMPNGETLFLESNTPASAEVRDNKGVIHKIDQRGLNVMEKLIPRNITIDK